MNGALAFGGHSLGLEILAVFPVVEETGRFHGHSVANAGPMGRFPMTSALGHRVACFKPQTLKPGGALLVKHRKENADEEDTE